MGGLPVRFLPKVQDSTGGASSAPPAQRGTRARRGPQSSLKAFLGAQEFGSPSWTRFELLPFARRQRSRRLSSGFKHLRLPEAPHAYSQSRRELREECGSCVNSSQRLVHSGY